MSVTCKFIFGNSDSNEKLQLSKKLSRRKVNFDTEKVYLNRFVGTHLHWWSDIKSSRHDTRLGNNHDESNFSLYVNTW